jgi:hypothetical protein
MTLKAAKIGSDDVSGMREFLLTPTLSLDDPMGVKKAPRVRKSLKAAKKSSMFFGGGGGKKKGAGADDAGVKEPSEKGDGGDGGDEEEADEDEDEEEEEEEEEYTTLHERMVQNVKDGDPVVVILLAIVVYLAFHRAVEHLPTMFACLVTLYGSRVYYKGDSQ